MSVGPFAPCKYSYAGNGMTSEWIVANSSLKVMEELPVILSQSVRYLSFW
jgi:hypothetical protein